MADNTLQTPSELTALAKRGLIYTDVHTLARVSPQGLTRGRVRNADDDGDDDGAWAAADATARATGEDDASEGSDDRQASGR